MLLQQKPSPLTLFSFLLAGAVELAADGSSSNREATSLSGTSSSVEGPALWTSLDANLLVAGGHDDVTSVGTRGESEGDAAHVLHIVPSIETRIVIPDGLASGAAIIERAQASGGVAGRDGFSTGVVCDPNALEVLARIRAAGALASEDVRLDLGKSSLDCGVGKTSGCTGSSSGDTSLLALDAGEDTSLLYDGRAAVTLVGGDDGISGRASDGRALEGHGAETATTLSSTSIASLESSAVAAVSSGSALADSSSGRRLCARLGSGCLGWSLCWGRLLRWCWSGLLGGCRCGFLRRCGSGFLCRRWCGFLRCGCCYGLLGGRRCSRFLSSRYRCRFLRHRGRFLRDRFRGGGLCDRFGSGLGFRRNFGFSCNLGLCSFLEGNFGELGSEVL